DDKIIEFCTHQDDLTILAKENGEDIMPYDFATRVIRFPEKYPVDVYEKAGEYRVLFHQASKTMKEKYDLIEKLLVKYAKSPSVLLPGNYDIDLQYTALYERDLHRKTYSQNGIKFAGYGGAPIATSGIPEKLAVKYHEYNRKGSSYSEIEEFFKEELPDIAVIHNPAYGFLDKIPGFGHIGSQGMRRYIDEFPPSLVVSGHVHEDQGIIKKGQTVFLNPSNFGPVDSVYGFQQGGFFSEIELVGKKVASVALFRLVQRDIIQLINVDTSDKELKITYCLENSPVPEEEFVRQ
ncbi:MAG: phosphoesterase, partial [Leptospira sp.]|nr:phosphoesterase [Leptospira sp.]